MESLLTFLAIGALLLFTLIPVAILVMLIEMRQNLRRTDILLTKIAATVFAKTPQIPHQASQDEPAQNLAIQPPPVPIPKPSPTAGKPKLPRQPNAFELATRDLLAKIWNWIIVGEEYRRPGLSVEFAIATNWLLRAGVLIILFGMAFFLKYAVEKGMLGPQGRVTLTTLAGALILGGGIRMQMIHRYNLLAHGLMGTGLALLYFASFAASNLYHLTGAATSFALMFMITAGAGLMATRFNSILMALIGIIGGYGTPVALATGTANFTGLFAYMLILGIGVLVVATRRHWPLLNILAMLSTYGIAGVSIAKYFQAEHFWEIAPFLGAFFMLFAASVIIFQIRNRCRITAIELFLLILNAMFFFGLSHHLIKRVFDLRWTAAVSLALAVFYCIHVAIFIRRRLQDRTLVISFMALASLFLILTAPLLFARQWITVFWSAEAFVLTWVAVKLDSRMLRHVAYLLYLITFYRFFMLDLQNTFTNSIQGDQAIALRDYLTALVGRLVSFGAPIVSAGAAARLTGQTNSAARLALGAGNDIADIVPPRRATALIAAVFFAMAFLFLHLELNRTCAYLCAPLRMPILSGLWAAACLAIAAIHLARKATILLDLLYAFTIGFFIKLLCFDMAAWNFIPGSARYADPEGYLLINAGMRLLDCAIALVFLLFVFQMFRRRANTTSHSRFFGYSAIALFFGYASLEINTLFYHFIPGLRAGGISIFWVIFALGLILCGILKSIRPLRLTGLALFALTSIKVFILDLDSLEKTYRIIAFLLVGATLICASFVYLKFRETFTAHMAGKNKNP